MVPCAVTVTDCCVVEVDERRASVIAVAAVGRPVRFAKMTSVELPLAGATNVSFDPMFVRISRVPVAHVPLNT